MYVSPHRRSLDGRFFVGCNNLVFLRQFLHDRCPPAGRQVTGPIFGGWMEGQYCMLSEQLKVRRI
jgi:hypothetical protein